MSVSRIFLLSPAHCGGKRAAVLLNQRAGFPLAQRLRSAGITLGEAFSFLSGLYFRGKLDLRRPFRSSSRRQLRGPDYYYRSRLACREYCNRCPGSPCLRHSRHPSRSSALSHPAGPGCVAPGTRRRDRVTRQRSHRQVRRRTAGGDRRPAAVSLGVCRTRRHESGGAAAAGGSGRSRAGLRAGGRRRETGTPGAKGGCDPMTVTKAARSAVRIPDGENVALRAGRPHRRAHQPQQDLLARAGTHQTGPAAVLRGCLRRHCFPISKTGRW